MILGEKIERKVYVNQRNFVSDMQLLIKHSFLLSFLHELLMSITNYLLTESKVKYQTEVLLYCPSDSEVNTARPRFDILPERLNSRG